MQNFMAFLDFSGSKFIEADFRDTMFYDKTLVCYCEFEDIANFKGSTFDRNSIFINLHFAETLISREQTSKKGSNGINPNS